MDTQTSSHTNKSALFNRNANVITNEVCSEEKVDLMYLHIPRLIRLLYSNCTWVNGL